MEQEDLILPLDFDLLILKTNSRKSSGKGETSERDKDDQRYQATSVLGLAE